MNGLAGGLTALGVRRPVLIIVANLLIILGGAASIMGLDVRELPNVVLLPHMSSATEEGRIEMGEKVIINIKTYADGHRPPDQVVPGVM
jgi:lactate dehydrogenase-like 2-hydroxyacid dehydrogenase